MFECVICLEEYEPSKFTFFTCKHGLCNICYSKVRSNKNSCPLCRSEIQVDLIAYSWECMKYKQKLMDESLSHMDKALSVKRKLPISFMRMKYHCSVCKNKTKKTKRSRCIWKNCPSNY